ncbi:hypothetical protein [uncultured Tateyamaria sp.]|uniref:hypothetical protein n=1 Tax=uncultured Tateyamaria sp. TaxID=455651 RepID=UPI00261A75D2|nr:hypothetical protein [uncultured Tateyamaria sp.]
MIEFLQSILFPKPEPSPFDWETWAAIATVGTLLFAVLVAALGQLGLLFARLNRRREKMDSVQDLHTIIYAHIKTVIYRYGSLEDQKTQFELVRVRMEQDPQFIPFFSQEPRNVLVQPENYDLRSLPRSTLEPIFVFYDALAEHELLVAEMRTSTFSELSPERRISIVSSFEKSYERLHATGTSAMNAIDAQHGGSGLSAGIGRQVFGTLSHVVEIKK